MKTKTTSRTSGRAKTLLHLAALSLLTVAVACGSDDDSNRADEGPIEDHAEVEIGSTAPGGGKLAGEFTFERAIALFFNECLGGSGETCEGGTAVYSAANPGLASLDADEPENGIYALEEGTTVSMQITAIDALLRMELDGATLDGAGQSAVLGTGDFHADVSTLLALPGGQDSGDQFDVSFRLSADAPQYEDSDELTLHFVPVADTGDDGHEHEE